MERIETLEALIDDYCQVWSERDAQRREQGLARLWAASATYTDPTVDGLDGQALLQHIDRVQGSRPGARVERCTRIDAHHGCARFGFRVIGSDGMVLREGVDFAFVSGDGSRIERIVGFFGDLASTPRGPHVHA